jgi:hypothetical protein
MAKKIHKLTLFTTIDLSIRPFVLLYGTVPGERIEKLRQPLRKEWGLFKWNYFDRPQTRFIWTTLALILKRNAIEQLDLWRMALKGLILCRTAAIFRHPKVSAVRNALLQPFAVTVWICILGTWLLVLFTLRVSAWFESTLDFDESTMESSWSATILATIGAVSEQGSLVNAANHSLFWLSSW